MEVDIRRIEKIEIVAEFVERMRKA